MLLLRFIVESFVSIRLNTLISKTTSFVDLSPAAYSSTFLRSHLDDDIIIV